MEWAVRSLPGTREVNEDSTGIIQNGDVCCFVVADGLGGHGMGDMASRLAVEAFGKVFAGDGGTLEDRLAESFHQAQADILGAQVSTGARAGMKTTAVALAVSREALVWAHVGDSRLYSFRWGRARQCTEDHSVPQYLVRCRELRPKQIRFHPDRNKLLRVLGVAGETPRFQISQTLQPRKGQRFLLCSDGFWELVTERQMCQCLRKAASAEDWLERMMAVAQAQGQGQAMDNLTAIGVWI